MATRYVTEEGIQKIMDRTKAELKEKAALTGATMTGELKAPSMEFGENAESITNGVLVVGNGESQNSKSTVFYVDKNGNMVSNGEIITSDGTKLSDVKTKLGSVYTPKGTINYSDLTAPSKDQLGFVYNVKNMVTSGDTTTPEDLSATVTRSLQSISEDERLSTNGFIVSGYRALPLDTSISGLYKGQSISITLPDDLQNINTSEPILDGNNHSQNYDSSDYTSNYLDATIETVGSNKVIKLTNKSDEELSNYIACIDITGWYIDSAHTGVNSISDYTWRFGLVLPLLGEAPVKKVEGSFTIDNRFIEYDAANERSYPSGTNIVCIEVEGGSDGGSSENTEEVNITSEMVAGSPIPSVTKTLGAKDTLKIHFNCPDGYSIQTFYGFTDTASGNDMGAGDVDMSVSKFDSDSQTYTIKLLDTPTNPLGHLYYSHHITLSNGEDKVFYTYLTYEEGSGSGSYKYDILPGFVNTDAIVEAILTLSSEDIEDMWNPTVTDPYDYSSGTTYNFGEINPGKIVVIPLDGDPSSVTIPSDNPNLDIVYNPNHPDVGGPAIVITPNDDIEQDVSIPVVITPSTGDSVNAVISGKYKKAG